MAGFDLEKHLKPLVAGGLALFLIGAGWLYSSHQQRLTQLDRKIESARGELNELGETLQTYRPLENQIQKMKPKSSNNTDNLISAVENAAQQVEARSQLIYVRPQPDKTQGDLVEEGVEIKLEKLKLHQLIELLYQFNKTDQRLKVAQLRIRTRFDNPEQLDTSIILSRFKEKR
jgi:general secretion pathway protein M